MTRQNPLVDPMTDRCACTSDPGDVPVLDARLIPGPLRVGAILGALDGLLPGAAMILVAPHDPVPLLALVERRFGDSVDVAHVDREADLAAGDGVRVRFSTVA